MESQRRFEPLPKILARLPRDVAQVRSRLGVALTRISTTETDVTGLLSAVDDLEAKGRGRWDRATTGTQTISDVTTTNVVYPDLVREDDPAGQFTMNTGTGVCTINTTGWYRVTAGVGWTFTFTGAVTSNTHDVLLFLTSGGNNIAGNAGYFGESATQFSVSTTFYFTATSTVVAQVRQTTGANRTLAGSSATFFAIERL